mmetsp:Transcript_50017/g.100699  ORF Transcript_50017/g.100699 Transcript_50017/m.100699 type:complete len:215 (-) Transcript_50017:160-804(-)
MSSKRAWADVTLEFEGEEEYSAPSQVLSIASPVFAGMLESGMAEARNKRIKVSNASRTEFASFCELLMPGAWSPAKLTKENLDGILTLSDYYQVDFLKAACEAALLAHPVTVPRLVQAHTHGLKKQYERCIKALAQWGCEEELTPLEEHPRILMELTLKMRASGAELHQKMQKMQDAMSEDVLLRECVKRAIQSHVIVCKLTRNSLSMLVGEKG